MRTDSKDLTKAGLKHVVQYLDSLPAPSAVAGRILSLASSPDVNIQELSRLVEAEPSLSLRILRRANAASQGRSGEVRDIQQAVMVLGLEVVRTMALCMVVRHGMFASADPVDPQVRTVWEHSLACAVAAKLLAGSNPALSGVAFAAGLLHDCGKLALLAAMPEQYGRLVQDLPAQAQDVPLAEQQAVGVDHCLAGKWLLERWGLPTVFVEAVWLHHHPVEALEAVAGHGPVLSLVALADRLAHEVMGDWPSRDCGPGQDRLAVVAGFASAKALEEVKSRIGGEYAERAGLFDLNEDAAAFYFQALQKANTRLGDMAVNLAERRQELERAAVCLDGVAAAGTRLGGVEDEAGMLEVLAQALTGIFSSPEGLTYVLDAPARLFMARYFSQDGRTGGLTCRLAPDLAMDAQQLGSLPAGPAGLLATAQVRATALPTAGGAPLHVQDGYGVATLDLGQSSRLELIFKLPGLGLSPLELAAFRHLADHSGATLRRLRLLEQSRQRAESLGEAMRSMQTLNAKLMQTERLAAVGQLAAGAAHEINNPLAIISARAQLLEMKETDPARKKNFHQMVEQIERISSILGHLLDFARPSPLSIEPVSLGAVLERTLELVQPGLEKRGITVHGQFPPGLPAIMADSRQLEQVFLNLFINADHAMEAGGSLSVTLSHDQASDMAQAVIADTGVGIPKEHLGKIFDPFFTTKAEGKGTGLGLSTAYGILVKHRGEITVDSEPGRGTKVIVRLPRHQGQLKAPAQPDQAAAGPVPGGEVILVVDDEKHIRDILRESLESSGYGVATAGDGVEALAMLKSRSFSLVVLDIRMPQQGGLALLREAKAIISGLPVLVVTGMAGEEEIREAMDLGAAGCIRKPFQVEALIAEVRGLLAGPGKAP